MEHMCTTFRQRLMTLYKVNGYGDLNEFSTEGEFKIVADEMIERKIYTITPYDENIHGKKGITKEEQQKDAKRALPKQLKRHLSEKKYDDIQRVDSKWIIRYADFFHCSIDYLYDHTNVISETGLNNRALELLVGLKKNSDKMPVASEMLDMINTILGNDLDKVTDFLMTVGSFAKGYHSPTENIFPYEDLLSDTEKAAYLETIKLTRIRLAIQNLLS